MLTAMMLVAALAMGPLGGGEDPAKAAQTPVGSTERAPGKDRQSAEGDRIICKRVPVSGTRLGGKKVCGTPEQFANAAERSREWTQNIQGGSTRTLNGSCLPDHC